MGFANVVVDATPGAGVRRRLEAARRMTSVYGGKLVAVAAAWPLKSLARDVFGAPGATQIETFTLERALESTKSIFDQEVGAIQAIEWCASVTEPLTALCDHALTADLVITAAEASPVCAMVDPAELALRSGTPVLRLGETSPPFDKVIVGWKDTAEARRAAHEALPFLTRATSVLVVGVGEGAKSHRIAAVADHLKRHGAPACHVHLPGSGGVAGQLREFVEAEGASLLVTGAYSRSRGRERFLGGVTRDLLAGGGPAWLLAH
jgi:nucleotide-binding universal stress UspA family protein